MVELQPKSEPGRSQAGVASATGVAMAVFDVRAWKTLAAEVTSSDWGTQLEVELKWSLDRDTWYSFPTSRIATSDATWTGIDVEGIPYVGLDITTADTGASGPMARVWGQA